MNPTPLSLLLLSAPLFPLVAADPYQNWRHTGDLTILTTPEGANLPAGAVLEEFPLLVRLDRDWFDFGQAKPGGEDVRFSTGAGGPLAYQIEEWNAAAGTASVWVRIPRIAGNARQTIHLHWGKAEAAAESNGKAVFNEANGYLSVWHLGDAVRDEAGTLESKDAGTTVTSGVIGKARHFAGDQGVFGGEKIANYPAAEAPHSTEAWFRAERPNGTILGWGNEGGGRGSKVRMIFQSPPHVRVDSDFSDIRGMSRLPVNEWIHVVHTCGDGPRTLYINGRMDSEATTKLDIRSPARLWLGGWYHHYDFIGDLDEVRVSKVARTADWVRLQFENQKPLQTVVGPLVPPGEAFVVTPAVAGIREGATAKFTAMAGGAQKVFWSLVREERETIVAVDRFTFTLDAGRVTGDTKTTLRFKAILAGSARVQDIPATIKEDIPDPVFTLRAPPAWDGRSSIEVVTEVSNLSAMQTRGAGNLKTGWSVSPIAVIKESAAGKLILHRAQNSGTLTVTATVSNGGRPVTQTAAITVTEPKQDAWVARTPPGDEQPEDGQFYARDDNNEGTLFYKGTLANAAESVFLRLYADDRLMKTETAKPGPDKSYAFALKLKPGLIKYRIEFGSGDTVLHTAGDLVCGDAFLLNGQSNAVATDWGKGNYPETSEWIRSFGSMGGNPNGARWGSAIRKAPEDRFVVGCWAFDLAKRLVGNHKVPVCIINGAVGGTRIDQHQRNPADPQDLKTIYGRLLWRVREARLTHGIRGVLWHQGENDQGADGPTGGYGWETYRQYFVELAAAWKQDFPNIRHYHVFQIWPKSCSMGLDGSDNRLREVQRNLPAAFSNLSIMSTLGIEPPGGCHYPAEGYAEIARLICPLIERDHYGKLSDVSITPPNLLRAGFAGSSNEEITLEFDQPVKWDDAQVRQVYLDGEEGHVGGGRVAGNVLTLHLTGRSSAKSITYLDSREWSQKTLLRGGNGIAALTFCEVPLTGNRPGE